MVVRTGAPSLQRRAKPPRRHLCRIYRKGLCHSCTTPGTGASRCYSGWHFRHRLWNPLGPLSGSPSARAGPPRGYPVMDDRHQSGPETIRNCNFIFMDRFLYNIIGGQWNFPSDFVIHEQTISVTSIAGMFCPAALTNGSRAVEWKFPIKKIFSKRIQ